MEVTPTGAFLFITILINMTSNKNLIELAKVDGKDLVFERHGDQCWINLTRIAQQFGKEVYDWLRTKAAQEYLEVARKKRIENIRNVHESETEIPVSAENQNVTDSAKSEPKIFGTQIEPIITRKGNSSAYEQGTWATDTRVARRFFQWLSPEYAWEVDDFLDRIARGELVVSDNSTFLFRGKKWISCAVYCKQFGKSMNSIFGLKAHYPYSFMYVDNQWYMNPELFGMKEAQARFESRRLEVRAQNEDRQLSIQFPETEPNAKED